MRKIFTAFCLLITSLSFAQQDPQFSQNPFTRLMVNPGYAGASDLLCGTLMHRQQWVGLPGRPQTTMFTGDAAIRIGDAKPLGVGMSIISDELGFDKTFMGKLAVAYRLPLGPGNLGVGLEFGLLNKSVNGKWVSIDDYQQDANIPNAAVSANTLDLGFGLHYHIPGVMYAGISSTHLTAAELKTTNFQYSLARHYYIVGGYEHALNEMITLRPNLWVKTDMSSTQVDINVNALWNNMFWGGLSYRMQDAIVPMFGYQGSLTNGKGNYRIGYSYDVTTSQLRSYSNGSHEIMLGFCYDITPPPKITRYRNVRFL
jgi:type IX secretion system PorP/SprF family membrane protein